MKKVLFCSALLSLIMCSATALGATVESVTVSDPKNAIVTVTVDAKDSKAADDLCIVIKEKDCAFPVNNKSYSSEDVYITDAVVDENLKCVKSFKFNAKTGDYKVYVSDMSGQGQAGKESEQFGYFRFYSYEDILEYVDKLANRQYKQGDIYELVSDIGPSMGIGLSSYVGNTKIQNDLAENLYNMSDRIKLSGVDAVGKISELTCARYDLYTGMAKKLLTSEAYELLKSKADSAELKLSEFDGLNQTKKENVLSGLCGKSYGSYSEFKSDFDSLVEKEKNRDNGGSGSSGGNGGSKSSSSAQLPYVPANGKSDGDMPDTKGFNDLESVAWAKESIMYLKEKKIIDGVNENEFMPNNNVSRAQFLKMAVLAFNLYDDGAECDFTDVKSNLWHYKFIASAFNKNIVNGRPDGNFDPDGNITRQDMAAVLYRIAEMKSSLMTNDKKDDFADMENISDYAKEAVTTLAGAGIINGMENGRFEPNLPATRAQAAKMIYEMLKEEL